MSTMHVDAISDTAGTGSPSFPNGLNLGGTLEVNTLQSPTVAATDVTATNVTATNVEVTSIDLGDWTIVQSGSSLMFKHNGNNRFKLTSVGALTVEGDMTAFGDV